MTREDVAAILEAHRDGHLGLEPALDRLSGLADPGLPFASLDFGRELRTGRPEAIFGAGKSPSQLGAIIASFLEAGKPILATRVGEDSRAALGDLHPSLVWDSPSRTIRTRAGAGCRAGKGYVAIVCAGTSDLPVAEEAAITATFYGSRVERVYDVGVAGIHRLFARLELIRGARVVVAVAGMEGALAAVLGGLVSVPLIALPTSVGYGASLGGIAALLSMLNACSPGLSVVNIDNGFGAGYLASLIDAMGDTESGLTSR